MTPSIGLVLTLSEKSLTGDIVMVAQEKSLQIAAEFARELAFLGSFPGDNSDKFQCHSGHT